MKQTISVRSSVFLAVAVLNAVSACTTAPKGDAGGGPTASQNSPAYQFALQKAFSELETRDRLRAPASVNDTNQQARTAFAANFKKTRRFEVIVYPRFMELPDQRRPSQTTNIKYDEPARYQFRIDRQGHCALGSELVAPEDMDNCVQVEIRPLSGAARGQFVRIFMNPEYRVYGISYHEYDADRGQVKNARKTLRWDPSEPLSGELLSLGREIVPIDLPIYATNSVRQVPERLELKYGARAGQSCDGVSFKYRNHYGSAVRSDWCLSDPWPSVIETSRYFAVLDSTEEGNN